MFKAPRYEPGQEPSPEELRRLRAPESLIKAMKDILNGRDSRQGLSIRAGGRVRLPAPVEEPLVKIMTGLELLKLRTGKERLEKETVRRERQEKEVEVTWTIKDNDLDISLNRIKQWLSEGTRVTVSLTRKRRWLAPPVEVCEALIAKIRQSVAEVSDVKEQNVSRLSKAEKEARENKNLDSSEIPDEPLRGFGNTMTLSFIPKAKPSSLSDAVSLPIPWLVSDTQLKQHLKAIGAALKKGRNVRIELNESEGCKVKGALDRDEVFKAVRSECRQAKDVRVKKIEGDASEESGTVVLEVMGGVNKGFIREIEVAADLSSKDAELRMKWIDEWIKQGLEVTVWVDPAGDSVALEEALKTRLTSPVVKAEEDDSHGQKKFVVEKDKTVVSPVLVEMPAWKPAAAPAPSRTASRQRNTANSATDLLQSLSSGKAPQPASQRTVNPRVAGRDNPFKSLAATKSRTAAPQPQLPGNRMPALNSDRYMKMPSGTEAGIEELLKSIAAGSNTRPPQAFGRR
jgi:translation initiation factor IF-3